MGEMVERVGRAIAAAEGYAYDPEPYARYARAAIKAMREPTHLMVTGGISGGQIEDMGASAQVSTVKHVYYAMIDAALQEEGER